MIDHCVECGFDGRSMPLSAVSEALRDVPDDIAVLVRACDRGRLRDRPDVTGWSALEYVLHVRDLMGFHRWLIERAIAEDAPVIASPDPDAAVAAVDLDLVDVEHLLGQVSRRVDRLRRVLDELDRTAAGRQLVLQPDPGRIDVSLVSRSALHEAHHHEGDLARLIPQG